MNKLSASELHARYPYDQDEHYWSRYSSIPFEHAVAMADELHIQDDPLSYLEDIKQEDYSRASAINASLLLLPPEAVIDNYGEEVALWSSLSAVIQGENDNINAALRDQFGYDLDDLQIARGWVWRNGRGYSVHHVISLYGLMQATKTDALENIDLPELLTKNAKDGIELSQKRLGAYALTAITSDSYNYVHDGGRVQNWTNKTAQENGSIYEIYLDAPTGFALTYKGAPNAVTGLSMSGNKELLVNQIQGVKGARIDPSKPYYSKDQILGHISARGLAPLNWQNLMVNISEQLADNLQIPNIAIQSAANNVWTKPRFGEKEPHLSMDAAERIYDDTAKKSEYIKESDDNWHKPLHHSR